MPLGISCESETGYRVQGFFAYHIVPRSHDRFHIEVAREERNDPIRHDFAVLDQDTAKVSDHSRIISNFKPRADGHLIATPSNYLVMRLTPQR